MKSIAKAVYKKNTTVSRRPVSLVTGGAGFIGSHVVDSLIELGHRVVVIDDLSGGAIENVNKRAKFVRCSTLDYGRVKTLFRRYRFDYVYHLAAYAAEGLSHFIRRFNYSNNVLGSASLIDAAINFKCKCFVFTSSIAVYGAGQVPMSEETVPHPEDPYGIAKYAVELDLAAAKHLFGLNYVIFRPHNVYGERQNIGDKYRNVIGIFMNQVMQGMPCSIFGDGSQTRAFTEVSEVAPIIAHSVRNRRAYGQTFNLGSDKVYSVLHVAAAVQKIFKRQTGVKKMAKRREVKDAYSKHDKVWRYFKRTPPVELEAGLSKMAIWAKRSGSRKTSVFKDIEIRRQLPKSWRKR